MTDKKLTDLAPVAEAADNDLAYVVTDPAGTPQSRTIAMGSLLRYAEGNLQARDQSGIGNQTLALGVWTKITQFTEADSVANVIADEVDDSITIQVPGRYEATMVVSAITDAIMDLRYGIYYDGAEIAKSWQIVQGNQRNAVTVVAAWEVTTAGLKVEPYVRSAQGGDFDLLDGILQVRRTG